MRKERNRKMTIEELFSHVNDAYKVDNPFESSESDLLHEQLNHKFITPNYDKSFEEGTEAESLIAELIISGRKRAFSVGYRTAMSLILSCVALD